MFRFDAFQSLARFSCRHSAHRESSNQIVRIVKEIHVPKITNLQRMTLYMTRRRATATNQLSRSAKICTSSTRLVKFTILPLIPPLIFLPSPIVTGGEGGGCNDNVGKREPH